MQQCNSGRLQLLLTDDCVVVLELVWDYKYDDNSGRIKQKSRKYIIIFYHYMLSMSLDSKLDTFIISSRKIQVLKRHLSLWSHPVIMIITPPLVLSIGCARARSPHIYHPALILVFYTSHCLSWDIDIRNKTRYRVPRCVFPRLKPFVKLTFIFWPRLFFSFLPEVRHHTESHVDQENQFSQDALMKNQI